jgi:hypothetical protein
MMPADVRLRDQIRWFVNGRPIGSGEWICTQYVGRDRLYRYDFDTAEVVLWEARIPKHTFHAIYGIAYEGWLELLRSEPDPTPDRRSTLVREMGYPPLRRLTGEHFFVIGDEIRDNDTDLLELIYMDEPETPPVRTYAVQRVVAVVESRDSVRVFGIAVL